MSVTANDSNESNPFALAASILRDSMPREDSRRPAQYPPPGDWMIWLLHPGRGWGKLLDLDTPIPTPSGFASLCDIKVGDAVFDEAGFPCTVAGRYDDLPERAYRLHFSDHTSLVAGGEHQWMTWTAHDRKAYNRSASRSGPLPPNWPTWNSQSGHGIHTGYRGPAVRTTDEIARTLTYGVRRDRNHSIPICAPLCMPKKTLPLPPWLLGFWLGDGNTDQPAITVGYQDLEYVILRLNGYEWSIRDSSNSEGGDSSHIRLLGTAQTLRDVGVLGDKHVPHQYLWASETQRLELLRGLMDSDGYAGKCNVEFVSTLEHLADAVLHLARSLGEKPTKGVRASKLNGRDCGPAWFVKWRPICHNPFGLPRKALRVRPLGAQSSRLFHRMITKCECIPIRPMRCLTVDSPNSLFLAGEALVPTHNTFTGSMWIRDRIAQGSRSVALVGASQGHTRQVMVEQPDVGILAVCPDAVYKRANAEVHWPNGARAYLCSAENADEPPLRGGNFDTAWADECIAEGEPVLTDRGWIPVEQAKPGHRVMTREGWRAVHAAWCVGRRPVFKLTSSSGASLRATNNHRIWTPQGWQYLRDLTPSVRLQTWHTNMGLRLSGMKIVGTRTETATTKTAEASSSTSPNGKRRTVLAHAVTSFITQITTARTIASRISGLFRRLNIPDYTTWWMSTVMRGTAVPKENDPCVSEWPNSGTGREQTPSCSTALGVGIRSSRAVPERDSAPNAVNGALTTSTLSSIEPSGVCWVYDLNVDEPSEFIAGRSGGFLVHNCDSWGQETTANKAITAWENLGLSVRKGDARMIVTSTPKPGRIVASLLERARKSGDVVVTTGATYENTTLSPQFISTIERLYKGTQLERQEIFGEVLDEIHGALWRPSSFKYREVTLDDLLRVVVGVDPSGGGDVIGIVAAGELNPDILSPDEVEGEGPHYAILDDWSILGTPEEWSRVTADLYAKWVADLIAAEKNYGGEMVESTIKASGRNLPVKLVPATRGKHVRAEPISLLYDQKRVWHRRGEGCNLNLLEAELMKFTRRKYEGKGSHNHADAAIWAMTELAFGGQAPINLRPIWGTPGRNFI